jgi:hypothetical protein
VSPGGSRPLAGQPVQAEVAPATILAGAAEPLRQHRQQGRELPFERPGRVHQDQAATIEPVGIAERGKGEFGRTLPMPSLRNCLANASGARRPLIGYQSM